MKNHLRNEGCCEGRNGCSMGRRDFVKTAGAVAAAWVGRPPLLAVAGPFEGTDTIDHFVPVDKKLRPEWVKSLFAKGDRTWYEGDDLKTIGMPVGGICAGQVYLTGDGRLVYWDIFNQNTNSGFGQVNYKVGREPTEMVVQVRKFVSSPLIEHGAAVQVTWEGNTVTRPLDRKHFPGVRFCGEYPIAHVRYDQSDLPIQITLEAFSPFIPLNASDSALPATILNYTIKNRRDEPVKVALASWLENGVLHYGRTLFANAATRVNRVEKSNGVTRVFQTLKVRERALQPRPPKVLADFEGDDYGDWKVSGDAFGTGPARGTLDRQQAVSGFRGKGLVNTYLGGNDQKHGKLVSPPFTLDRPFLSFLVGGGSHEGKTCINLLVDGKVVLTTTGANNERLRPCNWDVRPWKDQQAVLEIIDEESGPWGHINVDQIELRDTPMHEGIADLRRQPDYGSMAISVLGGDDTYASAGLPAEDKAAGLLGSPSDSPPALAEVPLEDRLCGGVGSRFTLGPGEEKTITVVVSWHMPNMYRRDELVKNRYAETFAHAGAVADYVAGNFDRLTQLTRLWHATYYDSTLPHWLLDRLHSTMANLASTTCQWWGNGRFWAYEGCGCCHGTCGHVWNYAHGLARLFPELERSVREMQDFRPGVGMIAETGEIRFRGEGWGRWAGDSQGGYILKAYREHQMSPDGAFLERNWEQIKKALQFLIDQDGNADGLIEGEQHQTYDQEYFGANTMVGSLYLGALRAGEEMALEMNDPSFAQTCRRIFEAGQENSVKRLFNGEYYIQDVDLKKHPDWQYADGCLADQMFGQGWAHQVQLGYLYPRETVVSSLQSIWKYCWAPDVGPQNEHHPPARWFAYPGEAGLFTCTWPKSRHLGPKSTRYRNEIWTGIEYQVASHMAYEGMLTEALAICRAVHDRYHPAKHNPFNEIECGDHYARALASWGVLLALAGFEYHGPKKHIGWAPRLTPDDFRCVFTAADSWGTIAQQRGNNRQVNRINVAWGTLHWQSMALEVPEGKRVRRVLLDGRPITEYEQRGERVTINVPGGASLEAKKALEVVLELTG